MCVCDGRPAENNGIAALRLHETIGCGIYSQGLYNLQPHPTPQLPPSMNNAPKPNQTRHKTKFRQLSVPWSLQASCDFEANPNAVKIGNEKSAQCFPA